MIETYLASRVPNPGTRQFAAAALRHLLRFLVEAGGITAVDAPVPWAGLVEVSDDAGASALGPIDARTISDFLVFLNKRPLRKKPPEAATARAYISRLRQFFTYLVDKGVLQINPCEGLASIQVKPAGTADRVLDDGELVQLLRYLARRDGEAGDRDYAMVITLVCTGCRPGEFCRLLIRSVNRDRGTITLRAVGHGTTRERPLLPSMVEAFRDYLRHRPEAGDAEPLFRREDGRAWTPTALRGHLRRLLRAAGITRRLDTYAFGHTDVDLLFHAGARRETLQAARGHRDARTQAAYRHPPLAPVPEAIVDLGVAVIRNQIRAAASADSREAACEPQHHAARVVNP